MYYALICGFGAVSAVLLTLMGFKIMQILQLSSYRVRGLGEWLKSTKFEYLLRYFSIAFFSFISMLVYVGCFGSVKYVAVRYLGLIFYFANAIAFVIITLRQKNKTPLKFTPRIVRHCVLNAVLLCAASFGAMYLGTAVLQNNICYSIVGLLPITVPVITLLSFYILKPFEALNNLRYLRKARKKLSSMPNLIKIGITGSYGKTTAKNILAAMLQKKYNVLSTPSSYNTPMGIAVTVNKNLGSEHNVFIAEMGARYVGDIAELAKLVSPSVGIITAIGKQHLATFGSVENIASTKYELIKGLSDNGVAVFSSDNEYTLDMYAKTTCKKLLAGGINENNAVSYDNVAYSENGTDFDLICGDTTRHMNTKLLGAHIPQLVAFCAAAAMELGVELEDIGEAVSNLPQVEHRLQLIKNGEVTVIDDAYNSNAAGAKNALQVLKSFGGTRVIITPGLVEMGAEEQSANEELGACVVGCADYAYFIGARAKFLQDGAIRAGMQPEHVEVFADLDSAVKKLGELQGAKTVLFENDLPDNL